MIFLVGILLAAQPVDTDCSKVRWYVQHLGRYEAIKLAHKWGYTDDQIKVAEAKCLKR